MNGDTQTLDRPGPVALLRQLAKDRLSDAPRAYDRGAWSLVNDWASEVRDRDAEASADLQTAIGVVSDVREAWTRAANEQEVDEFSSVLVFCRLEALENLCRGALRRLALLVMTGLVLNAMCAGVQITDGDDLVRRPVIRQPMRATRREGRVA